MGKPKILELDLVRAAAILAVLVIHGTSEACCYYIPSGSRSQIFYLALNKFSNFAVPLFIMLSGIVLFYRYEQGWNLREALTFYRKRLQYVVVPYLIWSLFYYLYNAWVVHYSLEGFKGSVMDFLDKIRWADTGYHLYFIIIIAQLYLLFPLLMTLVKSWKWFGRHFIWIGLLTQLGFYLYHTQVHPFEHYPSLWFTYIGLFCVGGFIGLHYDKVRNGEKHLWWVFAAALLIGYTYFFFYVMADRHIHFPIPLFDILFNLYPIAVALSFLWIGRKLLAGMPRVSALLASIGTASFAIYFMHPAVLTLLRLHFGPSAASAAYHVFTFGSMGLALLVPWGIAYLLKKWRGAWVLFGR